MKFLFLLGRLIFGGFFLYNGITLLARLSDMSLAIQQKGLPLPMAFAVISGLLILIGGLGIIIGKFPKIALFFILLFLVPVTLIMHNFWSYSGAERMMQLGYFLSNLSLIGASLLAFGIPSPWPLSFDYGRKRNSD